jgi:hypothetical protein
VTAACAYGQWYELAHLDLHRQRIDAGVRVVGTNGALHPAIAKLPIIEAPPAEYSCPDTGAGVGPGPKSRATASIYLDIATLDRELNENGSHLASKKQSDPQLTISIPSPAIRRAINRYGARVLKSGSDGTPFLDHQDRLPILRRLESGSSGGENHLSGSSSQRSDLGLHPI